MSYYRNYYRDMIRIASILRIEMEMQGFETKSLNGRPAGSPDFIAKAQATLGRSFQRGKPGPKARKGKGNVIG